ncbi:hypothetical protein ACWEQ8_40555 [Streptomyces noursei]
MTDAVWLRVIDELATLHIRTCSSSAGKPPPPAYITDARKHRKTPAHAPSPEQ